MDRSQDRLPYPPGFSLYLRTNGTKRCKRSRWHGTPVQPPVANTERGRADAREGEKEVWIGLHTHTVGLLRKYLVSYRLLHSRSFGMDPSPPVLSTATVPPVDWETFDKLPPTKGVTRLFASSSNNSAFRKRERVSFITENGESNNRHF